MLTPLQLDHEIQSLEADGFKVKVSDTYRARVSEATDDWDFADCQDDVLIQLTKDGCCLQAISAGERDLVLHQITGLESTVEVRRWRNALLDPTCRLLLRELGDDKEFEFLGNLYRFAVANNGWFEDVAFKGGIEVEESLECYYDVPTPLVLATRFKGMSWETIID